MASGNARVVTGVVATAGAGTAGAVTGVVAAAAAAAMTGGAAALIAGQVAMVAAAAAAAGRAVQKGVHALPLGTETGQVVVVAAVHLCRGGILLLISTHPHPTTATNDTSLGTRLFLLLQVGLHSSTGTFYGCLRRLGILCS